MKTPCKVKRVNSTGLPELDLVVVSLGSAYSTKGTVKMRDDWFPNVLLGKVVKQ